MKEFFFEYAVENDENIQSNYSNDSPCGTGKSYSFVLSIRPSRSKIDAAANSSHLDSISANTIVKDNMTRIVFIGITDGFGTIGAAEEISFQ